MAVRRPLLAATLSLAAGACSSGGAASPARVATDSTGYLLVSGADTVQLEGVERRGDTLRGALVVGGRVAMRYDAVLPAAEDADARAELVFLGSPGRPGGTERRGGATVRGGGAELSFPAPGRTRTVRLSVAPGTRPIPVPAVGVLARAIELAVAAGRSDESFLVLPVGGAERAHLRRLADSVVVTVDGQEWRLALDAAGRVAGGRNATRGLVLRRVAHPAPPALAARPSPLDPPAGAGPYDAPADAPYRAVHVRVPTRAGHTLVGTLTLPAGVARAPVVLLVSGSSPQDRDMSEGPTPYRPFRQLADTLGRRGVAVLRVDDRGVGESGGDFASSTTADRADDARAAVAFLRARPDVDPARVFVAGLSEGGAIAPILAADDSTLRGIVLMAAPGGTGHEVARFQTRWRVQADPRIPPSRRDSAYAAQMREWDGSVRRGGWAAFFAAHDPLTVARRVRVPALVLHGDADRLVPPEHADRLAAAFRAAGNRDVTVRHLAGVSHPMLADPDGTQRAELYLHSFDLAPVVVGTVVEWVVARAR